MDYIALETTYSAYLPNLDCSAVVEPVAAGAAASSSLNFARKSANTGKPPKAKRQATIARSLLVPWNSTSSVGFTKRG